MGLFQIQLHSPFGAIPGINVGNSTTNSAINPFSFLDAMGGPVTLGFGVLGGIVNMFGKKSEEEKKKKAIDTFISELYKIMPGETELVHQIDSIRDMHNSGAIDTLNSSALSLGAVTNPEAYQGAVMGKMIGERNRDIVGAQKEISGERNQILQKIAGLKAEASGLDNGLDPLAFGEGFFGGSSAGLDIFSTIESFKLQKDKWNWLKDWK